MITGIGISAFQPQPGAGAGKAASRPGGVARPGGEAEGAGQSQKNTAAVGKNTGAAGDRVPLRPTNIGGGSAIAAQIEAGKEPADAKPATGSGPTGLSESERAKLKELEARDREVKAHEAAHQAVGGRFAGAASFTFERGPNGRLFAIGGEVPIDAGAVPGDPEATITKLRTVRRAALAPVEPSAQDRSVAASAAAGIRKAQAEKRAEAIEERAAVDAPGAPERPGGTGAGRETGPSSEPETAIAAPPVPGAGKPIGLALRPGERG